MKDKIITSKNSIFAPSVGKESSIDLLTFLSNRFYSVNHSHNSAIITGSSLAYQNFDLEHDTILDSAGISITKNKLGVINGARVAVTDGLGGGVGDGLIIVLDKQLKIKYTACARHIYRGLGQWTPPSVQMLASVPNRDQLINNQKLSKKVDKPTAQLISDESCKINSKMI